MSTSYFDPVTETLDDMQIRLEVTPVAHGTLPRFELKARRFTDHRCRA